MSANQFNALCGELTIAPEVALENDNLREALRTRNDSEVERILREEF